MLENPLQTSISCESYKSGSEESVGESCQSVEKLFVHESDMVEDEHDAEPDLCHSAGKLFVHESDTVEDERDAGPDLCQRADKLFVHESDEVEDEHQEEPHLCHSAGKLFVHESDTVEDEHDAEPDLCHSAGKLFVHESDMVEDEDDADSDICQSADKLFVHESDEVEDEDQGEPDLGRGSVKELRSEMGELELKVSSTLTLMDELVPDFQDETNSCDAEKKNLEVALSSKTAEVEELVAQINSRECQMEALMQKFRDEVFIMDREAEKDRKEREMDFIGKRRLLAEIREKEESWQNDLEAITQELFESREWARQKEEDIMILKEDLQALDERSKAEEERLSERMHSLIEENDVLKAALKQEQKCREAAEAEYLRLEEEHIILLKELSTERRKSSVGPKVEDTNQWGNAHVQPAVCRVANVDRQITDAMDAIENLREELDSKETQLVQANRDKHSEWEEREAALADEYKEMLDRREKQWQQLWMLKEQELLSANDKILHQLADQRGEFAIVQGALRELEWSINHGDIDIKAKLAGISKKEGMVKVHTSHLEEVDQYVLDLQSKLEDLQTKLEESEKYRKSAEVAASVRELKRVASFDLSLVQRNRDGKPALNMVRHDGHLTSHPSLDNGMNSSRIRTRSSLGDKPGLSGFSCIREIQPETYWEVENSSGTGRYGGSISSSTSYGQPRDDYSLSLLPPGSPGRRQQKWLVDAAWLENVRKEQTSLRQSLELERQRASSFGQIEAEYRMIEAAVVRAVEEKHESDCKVLDLQQEVRWSQPNPLFFCTPGFNAITSCSSPRGPPTTGSVEP
ncbi:hypothetical protein M758_3G162200 [Ceratodon purpureus]|nr:hypothetical protein M758_3G162200 [Ceratodon purpureus]